jgi:hypothetical protein
VVKPGRDWLKEIRSNLDDATAVIVIVTPVSINRPWVWFEVGASWSRMEEGEGVILPLCVPEIDKASLPEPLGRLQAMSLGKANETKAVFQALIDQFDFGVIKGFRYASLKAKLPRHDELPIAGADLESGTIYDGPYESYSRAELCEVVDDEIVRPRWASYDSLEHLVGSSSNLFAGQLIHFREMDDRYRLPFGTAKEVLQEVVTSRYPAEILQRTENTIRFKVHDYSKIEAWREDARA